MQHRGDVFAVDIQRGEQNRMAQTFAPAATSCFQAIASGPLAPCVEPPTTPPKAPYASSVIQRKIITVVDLRCAILPQRIAHGDSHSAPAKAVDCC